MPGLVLGVHSDTVPAYGVGETQTKESKQTDETICDRGKFCGENRARQQGRAMW